LHAIVWHLHTDERPPACLLVAAGAVPADAPQPISAGPFAVEARCFQCPPAPMALLPLRRVRHPAAEGALLLCTARQAAAVAASRCLGHQVEPRRWQEGTTLLADLRLLCWWMFIRVQPAQHAYDTSYNSSAPHPNVDAWRHVSRLERPVLRCTRYIAME
jgi:hypothetical protein